MTKNILTLLSTIILVSTSWCISGAQNFWEANECIRDRPFPILLDSAVSNYSFQVDTIEGFGLEICNLKSSGAYVEITHRGCEYFYLQVMISERAEEQPATEKTNQQITQKVIESVCQLATSSRYTFDDICEKLSKRRSGVVYPNVEVNLTTNEGMNEVFLINDCKLVNQRWYYYFEYSMGPL